MYYKRYFDESHDDGNAGGGVDPVINEQAPQDPPADPPEEKTAFQKRVDKLAAEKYQAINENQELKRKLAELEAQKVDPGPQPTTPATEPKLEDFDYETEDYYRALAKYEADRKIEEFKQSFQAEQQHQTAEQRRVQEVQQFSEKVAKFVKEAPDYDQVVNANVPINEPMAAFIRTSDKGPALAYHLGKNLDIAFNLSNMDPVTATRELARLELTLNTEPNRVSNAPEPPPDDIGGDNLGNGGLSDKMTIEQWVARRKELRYGKR